MPDGPDPARKAGRSREFGALGAPQPRSGWQAARASASPAGRPRGSPGGRGGRRGPPSRFPEPHEPELEIEFVSHSRAKELLRAGAKARAEAAAQHQAVQAAAPGRIQRSLPQGASLRAEAVASQPPTLPAWLVHVHRSHKPRWIGGFVLCEWCGASTSTALTVGRKGNLPRPCAGSVASGSAVRTRRLLRGQLPHQETRWPDARREATELAYPYPLDLSDEGDWRLAQQGKSQ